MTGEGPAGAGRETEPDTDADTATGADDAERDATELTPGDVVAGTSGRPYLLGAGLAVTLFAATAGYVLAANNQVRTVAVFGALTLPGTPAAMAAYGAALSVLVLGGLFGLVSLASRYDDA